MSIREMNGYATDNGNRLARLLNNLDTVAAALVGQDPEPAQATLDGIGSAQRSGSILSEHRFNNDDMSRQLDRLSYLIEKLRLGVGVEGPFEPTEEPKTVTLGSDVNTSSRYR